MGKTEGSNNRILRKFVPQSTEDCYSVLERSIKSEANWLKRHKARVSGRYSVPRGSRPFDGELRVRLRPTQSPAEPQVWGAL